MKKLLTITSLLCAVFFSSCLKDKGFENNEYGINLNEDGSPPSVQFLKGNSAKTTFGVNVDPGVQIVELVILYTGATAPATDITVGIQIDNSILTAYNTANGTSIVVANTASVTVPTTVVIPAGQRFATLKIAINNTTLLNPNLEYGFGVKIISASNGVKLTSNMNQVFVSFTVKNKYDGVYSVTGTFVDFTNATFTGSYPRTYTLITTGANTVDVAQVINGELVPGYLFSANGAGSFFGNFGIEATFDVSTNVLTSVRNYYGNPLRPVTGVGNPSLGTGPPSYTSGNGRRAGLDPTGINKYDPATKTLEAKYFLFQASSPGGVRGLITEKMVFIRPR